MQIERISDETVIWLSADEDIVGLQNKVLSFLNKKLIFTLLTLSLLFSSCVQISSLQTAKTLPEDETILGISVAAYGANGNDFVGGELGDGIAPHVEIFGRQGIAKNFDAGLKLSSSANIAIDGKYQFFGDETSQFAIAVGAAFEYQYSGFENFVSRQTLPLYFSFHPNDGFALYGSSKFIHQFVSDGDNAMFLGGNMGIKKRLNPRFSVVAEGSNFFVFDSGFKSSGDLIYQAGIGFIVDLK